MWSRRIALGAVLLSLAFVAFLILRDGPVGRAPAERAAAVPRTPVTAPRPHIVSRAVWHADESLVREKPHYTGAARAVFIHHTGHGNRYDCDDAPEMLRSVQSDHVGAEGWDDIGYNFVVDRCGTIYEGRAGGVTRPVRGAHTKGFNTDTVGIAALGTFDAGTPVPRPMLDAIAKVAAWKLAPGIDPRGSVRLVSTNDESLFDKGEAAMLHVVSGHRDSYETDCPGDALYGKLPALREQTAALRKAATGRADAATAASAASARAAVH
ncbi:peptidoglycan recognition protein [uncultured Streptomyces sp.]|uniref:peptidoglycan recognition protein family protein n=1 Tax=uncultured Streptomyces sp. TaxID=174707 RepID=UPI002639A4BF|nr:peptidoglycan recognition protein [uncultured Streptomyces sp.]